VRNTLETVNALGTTKIRGVEADLTVRPVDGLTLGLSYAYTYTHVPLARNTVQEALNVAQPPVTTPVLKRSTSSIRRRTRCRARSIMTRRSAAQYRTALHLDGNYSDPVHSFVGEKLMTDKSFIVNGRLSLADIPMSAAARS
jgi:iron complex outermembrane receptor protein